MLEYHAALLADRVRTEAFLDALRQVIRPGTRVLDVGSGTGILAVAAAKMGADVVAVERTDMIDYALALARANHVDVRFLHQELRDLPGDAMAPVDIIVSEMIGNELFDEDIIPIFASARRFLKPGGILIPDRVRLVAAPVWSDRVRDAASFWNESHYGLDWSPLAECFSHHALSDREPFATVVGPGQPLPWVDLHTATINSYEGTVPLIMNSGARCNAVLLWWDARLAGDVELSLDPARAWPKQHWFRPLLPVRERATVGGETQAFRIVYDGAVSPNLWTWSFAGETRSSFFAFPPSADRRARLRSV